MEFKTTGRDRGDIPAWAGWCFMALGTVSLLVGLSFGARSVSLGFGTVRTQGTIVGQDHPPGSGFFRHYLPVVAYQANGKAYQCKGIVGSDSSRFKTGQRVGVLYRKNQPSVGYVDTFFDRWLIPLAFGGAGLFFVLFGYVAKMPDAPPAGSKKQANTDELE